MTDYLTLWLLFKHTIFPKKLSNIFQFAWFQYCFNSLCFKFYMNISRLVAFNTSLTRMSILSKIRVTFLYYYCIGFLLLIYRVRVTLICPVLIVHNTVCRNDLRWHCQPNIYSRWAELLPTWCQSRSALDGDHNCFELKGL